ncbi:phosphoserine phosphatase SerB [Neisseriaceae bacterium ESL0693]|nr:phosphoserine phosphatase SerB [Neisseriaceae bacterium ESL0693]
MSFVLVLQHPQLASCDLTALQPVLTLASYAFDQTVLRQPVAADFCLTETIQARLQQQQIDYAVIPDLAFADFGLLVSDMDSTLITIECIDEIAAGVGIKAEISAITERAMRGELDFAQSLRARVALLKGLSQHHLQRVYDDILTLSPGALWLLQACQQHHIRFMLVSGGFTYFTERLQQQYGLDRTFANQLVIQNDCLTGTLQGDIIDAEAKARLLIEYRQQLGLKPQQVIAMGDGANDIPMLKAAGIGIAYHAKPRTEAAADIAIRFGGLDCVRKWFR